MPVDAGGDVEREVELRCCLAGSALAVQHRGASGGEHGLVFGADERITGGLADAGERLDGLDDDAGGPVLLGAVPHELGVPADRGDVRAGLVRELVDEAEQVRPFEPGELERVVVERLELGRDGERRQVGAALVELEHRAIDGDVLRRQKCAGSRPVSRARASASDPAPVAPAARIPPSRLAAARSGIVSKPRSRRPRGAAHRR